MELVGEVVLEPRHLWMGKKVWETDFRIDDYSL